MSDFLQTYLDWIPGHIDEKGCYPTPAAVRLADDKVEVYAMAVDGPQIIDMARKNCLRPEVVEQIVALDTYCRPGQGTTLDSCLVLFHLRRGEPARVGVLEYSFNGGSPITKEVTWDNPFWTRQYSLLAAALTKAFARMQ